MWQGFRTNMRTFGMRRFAARVTMAVFLTRFALTKPLPQGCPLFRPHLFETLQTGGSRLRNLTHVRLGRPNVISERQPLLQDQPPLMPALPVNLQNLPCNPGTRPNQFFGITSNETLSKLLSLHRNKSLTGSPMWLVPRHRPSVRLTRAIAPSS